MTALSRRGLLGGLAASLIAAPSIVHAASLMPVRGVIMDIPRIRPVVDGDYYVAYVHPTQWGDLTRYGRAAIFRNGFTGNIESVRLIDFEEPDVRTHPGQVLQHQGRRL